MQLVHKHVSKHSEQQSWKGLTDFGSEASIYCNSSVLRHDPEFRQKFRTISYIPGLFLAISLFL